MRFDRTKGADAATRPMETRRTTRSCRNAGPSWSSRSSSKFRPRSRPALHRGRGRDTPDHLQCHATRAARQPPRGGPNYELNPRRSTRFHFCGPGARLDPSHRIVPKAPAHAREHSATAFLARALAWFTRHGVTVGGVMTRQWLGLSLATLRRRRRPGLRHIRTRPYTPRTNGKAERFIQSSLANGPTPDLSTPLPSGRRHAALHQSLQ